jgi:pimeloyl-ACP methyl ester carboxylesterase
MEKLHSTDGTTIAFDRVGEGPPLVLVSGASTTRGIHAPLAQLLAPHFRVFNYDRRGRGDSGDAAPYSVEREIEDLGSVVDAAGGEAAVFGNSSGAALALHAAASGVATTKLALWEPPFMVDSDAPLRQKEYVAQLSELLEEDRRGDAVALFMRTVGLPEEMIAGMREAPMWPALEAIAHTLLYDATIMGDSLVPADVAASVTVPTLVLNGSNTGAWAANATGALADVLPNARRRTLDGQDHNVSWDVLAPVLRDFLRNDAAG